VRVRWWYLKPIIFIHQVPIIEPLHLILVRVVPPAEIRVVVLFFLVAPSRLIFMVILLIFTYLLKFYVSEDLISTEF
jgi:hypothetical protein